MIHRRALLGASALLPLAAAAQAHPGLRPGWPGRYHGEVRLHGVLPLEGADLPSGNPATGAGANKPFAIHFEIRAEIPGPEIWLRMDDGMLQTPEAGETLRFAPLIDGVAVLASAESAYPPRSATLTVQPELLSTEALFVHADGTFWRRHFTVRFRDGGGDVIFWVFDAAGTRARTWRGTSSKRPG
ncbi:MAG: hypothetical protein ACOY4R_02635 [Pseudomonadota bacterium]